MRGVVGVFNKLFGQKKGPENEPVGSTPGASRLCGVVEELSSVLAKKRAPEISQVLNSRARLVPMLGA